MMPYTVSLDVLLLRRRRQLMGCRAWVVGRGGASIHPHTHPTPTHSSSIHLLYPGVDIGGWPAADVITAAAHAARSATCRRASAICQ